MRAKTLSLLLIVALCVPGRAAAQTAGFSLLASPAMAYAGQKIAFTVTTPVANTSLAFGDGSGTILPAGTATVTHVYLNQGSYVATLTAPPGPSPLVAQTNVQIAPIVGVLQASPARGLTGSPFSFVAQDVRAPGFPAPPPLVLSFGDGSAPAMVPASAVYAHAYAKPGTYLVQLLASSGAVLAATTVEADVQTARVPIGAIYSVLPSLSPVLAGSDITLLVTYNLLLPPTPFVSQAPALEAVVDLLTPQGRIVRRSDPFSIAYSSGGGPGLRVARIPYNVPVDAAGAYKLRVYFRSAQGGAVALADAIPFLVTGGPDPVPNVSTAVHASGAIEAGPHAGSSPATLNADLTTALQWPSGRLALSGLFDPVSRRLDPNLAFFGGPPATIGSPDSTQGQPHGNPSANLGLTQAKLPSILGGGDQLRGFDWTNTAGPFTYQFGYGYTQIGTSTQSAQYGSLFDVSRTLSKNGGLEFAIFSHADQADRYVPTPSLGDGPYSSHAAVLEYHQQAIKHLTLIASGSIASAANELNAGAAQADASDKMQMQYANGGTSGSLEYDNAGEYMGLGGGPGALADRANFLSSLQFALSPISTLALGYNRVETRSVFSRQTDTFLTYSLTPGTTAITFSLRSDGQLAAGADTSTEQLSFGVSKNGANWNLAFNGNISSLRDAIGNAGSTTRTASLQYSRQAGRHTLSFGLNGNAIGGLSGSAQVAETLAYGFPFATRPNGSGFEFITQLDNTNTRSFFVDGRDMDWNAILSYHLGTHVSIGIVGDFRRHAGPAPLLNQSASALRARLDVQL